MILVSGKVHALKKPGIRKNKYSLFEGFFPVSMYFKAKLIEVIGKNGDPFFYVGPGFKDKCAVIYIKHSEYIKESARCEGPGLVDH